MGAVGLSERLKTLAEMVTRGNRVADVGCDHGFVAIYLVQQGISPGVIASDVRQGPLSRAREHVVQQGLEAYIETRLSDGLTGFGAGEADTLICAGMGGRLMQRILKQGENVALDFKELILQPQSELEEFRGFLRREQYRIVQERILCEEGKYYFFLKAVPGKAGQAGKAPGGDALGGKAPEGKALGGEVLAGKAPGGEASGGKAPAEAGPALPSEVPRRLADKYGGLLLQRRDPVLREYLEFMRETYRQVAEQIEAQIGAQIAAQIEAQTGAQIAEQIEAQIGAQIGAQTGAQIGAQAGNVSRAEKRLAEIRSELADIGKAIKFYTQEGR